MSNQQQTIIDALAPGNVVRPSDFPYPIVVSSYSPIYGLQVSEGPTLNGARLPGQWLLVEAKKEFGFEIRMGNYQTGATIVPKGDPLVKVRYDVRIWTPADAAHYRSLLRTTLSRPVIVQAGQDGTGEVDGPIPALSLNDPSLKDIHVSAVVPLSVTPLYNPLVSSGGKGPWTASVEFLQFRPPKPSAQMPNQDIPDQGPVTPDAVASMSVANALIAQGDAARQAAAAALLIPR